MVDNANKGLFRDNYKVHGDIALAQQTPWIQNATIKNNILYNQPMDVDQYVDTIRYCELQRDLEIFNAGDMTEIGERGVNLSGG